MTLRNVAVAFLLPIFSCCDGPHLVGGGHSLVADSEVGPHAVLPGGDITSHDVQVANTAQTRARQQSSTDPVSLKLVIASLKGGGGKSNIAANLAVAFHRLGLSVVIIDADRVMNTSEQWHDDRESYIETHPDADVPRVTVVKKTGRLGSVIEEFGTSYQIVIVDTGGHDSAEMRSAFGAVDMALTPVEPTQESLDGLSPFVAIVDKVRDLGGVVDVVAVLSRVVPHSPKRVADARQYLRGYVEENDLIVADAIVSNRVSYPDSKSEGLSVVETKDPTAKAEIEALAAELLAIAKGR